VVDGSKCISYLTIELKNEIPLEFAGKLDNWAFGCDVCQQVCPWNKFAKPHQEAAFMPSTELLDLPKKEWEEITDEVFEKLFSKSAVKRTKLAGLKRNIAFLKP
jgi:epoxyqueuosine reductase